MMFDVFKYEIASFLSTRSEESLFWPIVLKTKKDKVSNFLAITDTLTPSKKCKVFDFFKSMLMYAKVACFLSKRSENTFFWPILVKKKKGQNFHFLTKNHELTRALSKMQNFRLF